MPPLSSPSSLLLLPTLDICVSRGLYRVVYETFMATKLRNKIDITKTFPQKSEDEAAGAGIKEKNCEN